MEKLIENDVEKYRNEKDQSLLKRMQMLTKYLDKLVENFKHLAAKEKLDDHHRQFFQSNEQELLLLQNMIEYELKYYEDQHQPDHDGKQLENGDDNGKFQLVEAMLKDAENFKQQVENDSKNPDYNVNILRRVQNDLNIVNDMGNHLKMFVKNPKPNEHELYQLHQIEQEMLIIQNRLMNGLYSLENGHHHHETTTEKHD